MGKKNQESTGKGNIPSANAIVNRDIIQRLNFLYQASVYLNQLGVSSPHKEEPHPHVSEETTQDIPVAINVAESGGSHCKRGRKKRRVTPHDLSRDYVKAMKTIGQKTTVRMSVSLSVISFGLPVYGSCRTRDPSVKRTICKTCSVVLVPGLSASVRVKCMYIHANYNRILTMAITASPNFRHTVTYTCLTCSTSRRIPAPPIAAPEFYPSPSILPSIESSAQGPDSHADIAMNEPEDKESDKSKQKLRRKSVQSRPLPSFARDEHAVFVGNQRLLREGCELGSVAQEQVMFTPEVGISFDQTVSRTSLRIASILLRPDFHCSLSLVVRTAANIPLASRSSLGPLRTLKR